MSFDLVLALRNATGAQSFVREVSTPGSTLFHHYLTDAQWVARFGPTKAEVARAESWLRQQGFPSARCQGPTVRGGRGTAAQVERAFGTKLGYFQVNGHTVRLAQRPIPCRRRWRARVRHGGVNQYVATDQPGPRRPQPAGTAGHHQEPPPPAAFRNPQPCSTYWGQKTDTTDPALYAPFTHPLPYDICGYKPAQLRGGYGLNKPWPAATTAPA